MNVEWLGTVRKQTSCTELFKILQGIGQISVMNAFKHKEHTRDLRSSHKIALVKPKTMAKLGNNDFVIRAINYWECLPEECKSMSSKKDLKISMCLTTYTN